MSRVDFKLDDAKLRGNLAELGPKVNKYITVVTDFGATESQREMKSKAPWIDRTGAARAGLWSKPGHTGSGPIGFTRHTITLGHAVDYGIWLEKKRKSNGGRPIIMPTVVETGKEVMRTLQKLFEDLDHPQPPRPRVDADSIREPAKPSTRQRATATTRTTRHTAGNRTRRTRRS